MTATARLYHCDQTKGFPSTGDRLCHTHPGTLTFPALDGSTFTLNWQSTGVKGADGNAQPAASTLGPDCEISSVHGRLAPRTNWSRAPGPCSASYRGAFATSPRLICQHLNLAICSAAAATSYQFRDGVDVGA